MVLWVVGDDKSSDWRAAIVLPVVVLTVELVYTWWQFFVPNLEIPVKGERLLCFVPPHNAVIIKQFYFDFRVRF